MHAILEMPTYSNCVYLLIAFHDMSKGTGFGPDRIPHALVLLFLWPLLAIAFVLNGLCVCVCVCVCVCAFGQYCFVNLYYINRKTIAQECFSIMHTEVGFDTRQVQVPADFGRRTLLFFFGHSTCFVCLGRPCSTFTFLIQGRLFRALRCVVKVC